MLVYAIETLHNSAAGYHNILLMLFLIATKADVHLPVNGIVTVYKLLQYFYGDKEVLLKCSCCYRKFGR